jgi:long-chain acyl-CoA synthetase
VYESLVHLLDASCRKFSERELFGVKQPNGEWKWITYAEFKLRVDACAAGLAALGVGPGDRVAIVSDNCVEWATSAYATYARGATFVPMYTAQLPSEWRYILGDACPKVVFAGNAKVYPALDALRAEMPFISRVIGFALPASDENSFAKLLETGRAQPIPWVFPTSDVMAGLIYTTGTTGDPKGVMLSHKNLCSNCEQIASTFPLPPSRSLAFLPWAHVYGQTSELHFFIHDGHSIALNDDVANLVANLGDVKPTILVAVPRIFNRIYDGINRQMEAKPGIIRKLFAAGVSFAAKRNRGVALSFLETAVVALADRLIFSKARARFGGRLQLVISGSAALNPTVGEFVDAIGIMVYEGYGLTETSPVVSSNAPGHRKMGTVGRPAAGIRVVIDESQCETPGEGEVIVYGDNVMVGYYKRPEETRAVLTADGGLRTGDLGTLDADGYLTITGRLKELYKLETGKYVAPVLLEEALKVSPFIANIVIYGANKPHNVAVVVAEKDAIARWAQEKQLTLGSLRTDHRVRTLLQDEVNRLGAELKSYERVKAIVVTDEDFTPDNGLLTPKLSVKRREVVKKYQKELDALYSNGQ